MISAAQRRMKDSGILICSGFWADMSSCSNRWDIVLWRDFIGELDSSAVEAERLISVEFRKRGRPSLDLVFDPSLEFVLDLDLDSFSRSVGCSSSELGFIGVLVKSIFPSFNSLLLFRLTF